GRHDLRGRAGLSTLTAPAPLQPPPPRRWRLKRAPRPGLLAAAVVAVGIAQVPLVYLVVRTAGEGRERVLSVLLSERVVELTARSLALTAVVTTACVVLGVGSAYLVTRTDVPGRRVFGVLAALPLAVPSYVLAYAWVAAVHPIDPSYV